MPTLVTLIKAQKDSIDSDEGVLELRVRPTPKDYLHKGAWRAQLMRIKKYSEIVAEEAHGNSFMRAFRALIVKVGDRRKQGEL